MSDDHPAVPVPPPLIHAAVLLAGLLLELVVALPLPGAAGRFVPGLGLIIAAVALTAAGIGTLRRHHTTVNPRGSANALVVDGPYRYSRNPLYVGLALAHAGLALMLGSGWMLLGLLPAVVLVDRFAIVREERYLARRFGADYAAYRQRARRWL